jgi:hypothetical protein
VQTLEARQLRANWDERGPTPRLAHETALAIGRLKFRR